MNSAVLSLFSTGRTTGLVIESGQGSTFAVPVFEGYALPHAIQSSNIAGQDVTQCLLESLMKEIDIDQSHFDIVRHIKEQMCEVAFDYEHALKSRDPLGVEQRSYELPDGKGIIQIDHKTRFNASEIIFNPSVSGLQGVGIGDMTFKAIEKCDPDLQIALYNNIVLAGGTTMMPGFKERFEHELLTLAGNSLKTDINVTADLHRKYAAWIGGSMISSLSTFEDMTIKRSEYEGSATDKGNIVLQKTIF